MHLYLSKVTTVYWNHFRKSTCDNIIRITKDQRYFILNQSNFDNNNWLILPSLILISCGNCTPSEDDTNKNVFQTFSSYLLARRLTISTKSIFTLKSIRIVLNEKFLKIFIFNMLIKAFVHITNFKY